MHLAVHPYKRKWQATGTAGLVIEIGDEDEEKIVWVS